MNEYHPEWRRPIAQGFRRTAYSPVQWCLRLGIHANVVSYSSIIASSLAALCFWQAGQRPGLLIAAVGFCYLRLWLNMLDGMVALSSKTASRSGEIANELPDRISDVLIFVGVAHSGLCHPLLGYWAAILALLVAYVGTLGQAVGAQREFSGLMAKPWRMVALHIGSWTALAMWWWSDEAVLLQGWSILDITLLVILLGCAQTVYVRLVRILRSLQVEERQARAQHVRAAHLIEE